MNKNLFAIVLAIASLALLPACGGKKCNECEPTEQTCKTRYSYDECDACYELDAQSDVEADCEAVNKF